jgi:hypothetical protein
LVGTASPLIAIVSVVLSVRDVLSVEVDVGCASFVEDGVSGGVTGGFSLRRTICASYERTSGVALK